MASMFYIFRNETYYGNYTLSSSNVQCIANGAYQWGFSTNITIAFIAINAFWIAGTYAIWLYVNRKSEFCRKGRHLGKYRAALDLVEAVTHDLGTELGAYSEKDLEQELSTRAGLRYIVRDGEGKNPSHISLSSEGNNERVKLHFGEKYC